MKTPHQQRIETFMRAAQQAVPHVPTKPSYEVAHLRARLILEEAFETINALGFEPILHETHLVALPYMELRSIARGMHAFDMTGVVDGCADLSVVTIGTLSALGVDDEPVLALVDVNNMAKIAHGHRDEHGKWLKSTTHMAPDIVGELARQVARKGVQS